MRHIISRLGVLLLSLAAGLVCAEFLLRISGYPYIGCRTEKQATEQAIGTFDPFLGWRYIPGTTHTRDGVTYTFSEEGYRSGQVADRSDSSKPLIVIVGDSTLFGDGINFEDTFGYKLRGALGGAYEVLNFAVQGYGLDQTMIRLNQVLSRYKPMFVIVDFIEDQDYRNVNRDRRYFFPCSVVAGTKPVYGVNRGRPILIHVPEPYRSYDSPRLRLVARRFLDALHEEGNEKLKLSQALFDEVWRMADVHHTQLLGINYQLPLRGYEARYADSILVATYSAEYVFPDGFHLNSKGTTQLTEDFLTKFSTLFEN